MTESEFQHNVAGANSLRSLSDPLDADYWAGYVRGTRRHYHGEKFGTAEEHKQYIGLRNEIFDDSRYMTGKGYMAGACGWGLQEAMKHLHVLRGAKAAASAAGSVRSEAKTLANRENAKKPRPNAQGKKKPRKPKTE